jgi:hypothetical protein
MSAMRSGKSSFNSSLPIVIILLPVSMVKKYQHQSDDRKYHTERPDIREGASESEPDKEAEREKEKDDAEFHNIKFPLV